ncbi:MAG: tRNA 2-thiocytidine(32) synthetase TtcA [Clostridiales bacterium]|nr:tRNA 2-thiocytidine(32) synthetase TtcA [Clostridiales bacterium]
MKTVLGCIRRADERFSMIEDGDKICIGVSGGKDSLLLMQAMKLYQRFSKRSFEIIAIALDLGWKKQDYTAIRAYAERIGVPFEVYYSDIGKVVFEYRQERSPCELCAKLRRGALNREAAARGCNKVALGHNREDVLETFWLSLLYEGRLHTFAPVTPLSRSGVTIIRPLILLPESYCLGMAQKLELPILPPHCDVAGHTKREEMKELMCTIQKTMPDLREKMMHALLNPDKYGLWDNVYKKREP